MKSINDGMWIHSLHLKKRALVYGSLCWSKTLLGFRVTQYFLASCIYNKCGSLLTMIIAQFLEMLHNMLYSYGVFKLSCFL